MNSERDKEFIPVIPVTESLLFPQVVRSLSVESAAGIAAAERAFSSRDRRVVVVGQREGAFGLPRSEQLFQVATEGLVTRVSSRGTPRLLVVLQGTERAVIEELSEREVLRARVRHAPIPAPDAGPRAEALERAVLELACRVLAARPDNPGDPRESISRAEASGRVYLLAALLSLELKKEQAILQAASCREALELMHVYLLHECEVLAIKERLVAESKSELSREQREYVLRQQLRLIKKELGEEDGDSRELRNFRQKLAEQPLPEEAKTRATYELERLERLSPSAPEHGVVRGYLECLLDLPWQKPARRPINLLATRAVLDQDHHGLEEVKARILEHLAVLQLNPRAKAPILCFEGPPGVGKTSLGQSIARALGRKLERVSLGGLHDESELRGHRRTYVGALPGRIIQALRRAGAADPVILLDEIDKLGRDARSDPSAALLEILDPEQNKYFRDNYVEVPFDLSRIMFITTANALGPIPRPLLDRLEVIHLSGYSEEEKVEIARRYLVPRQQRECGLTAEQLPIGELLLRGMIHRYTREAGVRQLERSIGRVARRTALRIAEGRSLPGELRVEELEGVLGAEAHRPEPAREELAPGVVPGLAWTEGGGDLLYVETTLLSMARGVILTGQLGEVMQESARIALSWIQTHAEALGIDPVLAYRTGIHLHLPAGAIPKDGPSAGVTMAAAFASALLRQRWRADTALTGELALTGLVLPVGGIKEKILAARRAGMRRVIIPRGNSRDLRDVPGSVRASLEILLVERAEELLPLGLIAPLALASGG